MRFKGYLSNQNYETRKWYLTYKGAPCLNRIAYQNVKAYSIRDTVSTAVKTARCKHYASSSSTLGVGVKKGRSWDLFGNRGAQSRWFKCRLRKDGHLWAPRDVKKRTAATICQAKPRGYLDLLLDLNAHSRQLLKTFGGKHVFR